MYRTTRAVSASGQAPAGQATTMPAPSDPPTARSPAWVSGAGQAVSAGSQVPK